MPMYEYECGSCGTVQELLVGVGSDAPEIECVSCGSQELRKLISLVSVNRGSSPDACCGGDCGGDCGAGCDSGTCACRA